MSSFVDTTLPVTLEFNDNNPPVAWVDISEQFDGMGHAYEYVMVPAIGKDAEGNIIVMGYSFVHYTNVMPKSIMKQKIEELRNGK